jgi:uncharacterized membrane protein
MDAHAFSTGPACFVAQTHVILTIACVGSSFYFVFSTASLTKPEDPELVKKVDSGELWAVVRFYHPQNTWSRKQMPQNLHWFYWEDYSHLADRLCAVHGALPVQHHLPGH